MKKLLTLLFLAALIGVNQAQEYPEKDKKYDVQIFEYLDTLTDQFPIDTFMIYSKPFSKWDIRPLYKDRVWVFDTVYTAGEIPNFIWGAFAAKYKMSKNDAQEFSQRFLNKGIDNTSLLTKIFPIKLTEFESLSKKIQSSNNHFFVSQISIQRIDDIYRENEQYWSYVIPPDSPFPMSDKTEKVDVKFSSEQEQILELMYEIKIYAAVKTKKGIFYLINGFTDNSFGYYYSLDGKMESDNFLFHILSSEKINPHYFYYIAN